MAITVTVSGKSGPNVTATNGDTINVTLSPAGTPGGVGPTGPAGPAASLSIGSVFKADNASATITGTAPNQVLNLTLPKGDTGAQGAKGDTGATGAQGPAGPANTLSIGTVSSGATAAATITGTAPTQTLNLTLPAGPTGAAGSVGPAGPANSLTIGTVNSGSTPSATITGTAPNQVLNLVLARGDKGEAGATGAAGPANSLTIGSVTEGSSAGASITGTAPNQTLNLTIPATTLSIGTVTTGAAGSSASATVTGTAPAQTINLTIPRGDKGDTGSTGAAGPANSLSIGTVSSGETAAATITGSAPSQTLNLTLPKGDKGDKGDTGSTGATGAAGATGPANSLSIGTVTTGAAGSSASATITGTAPTQTLNLTIPRGDKGDAGSGGGSFSWSSVPATSSSSGTAGNVAYDGSRLYVCTATNTWRAAALSRWDGDPYWANVSLLMHMEGSGASFTDLSTNAFTVTATGDATQSASQAKFGTKSASFSAGQIYLPANNAFNFGTGDFCIEFFAYFNSTASDQRLAGGDNRDSTGGLSWGVYTNATGTLGLYLSSSGSTWDIASPATFGSFSTGQWYHVAIARSGGTIRAYLNGTLGSSTSTSASLYANSSNGPFFGRQSTSNFNGFIDAVRITKGVGRYSGSTLTQPTAEFPDY